MQSYILSYACQLMCPIAGFHGFLPFGKYAEQRLLKLAEEIYSPIDLSCDSTCATATAASFFLSPELSAIHDAKFKS